MPSEQSGSKLPDEPSVVPSERHDIRGSIPTPRTIPFHVEGHGDLLAQARALSERPRLPACLRTGVDETVAQANICEGLCASIGALRADAETLLEERVALEVAAGLDPPSTLDVHIGWQTRCAAADRSWRAMQGDPGPWKPQLDALKEVATVVDRFEALRGYDRAWAKLSESHEAVPDETGRRKCLPFDVEDWGELVGAARHREFRETLQEDRCRLRETWRSDGAALGRVDVPFDMLMAGGALCAFRGDWEKRERQLRQQAERRRIVQEVEALKREWAIRYRIGLP